MGNWHGQHCMYTIALRSGNAFAAECDSSQGSLGLGPRLKAIRGPREMRGHNLGPTTVCEKVILVPGDTRMQLKPPALIQS
jgi:hypothetical protein